MGPAQVFECLFDRNHLLYPTLTLLLFRSSPIAIFALSYHPRGREHETIKASSGRGIKASNGGVRARTRLGRRARGPDAERVRGRGEDGGVAFEGVVVCLVGFVVRFGGLWE